MADLSDAMPYTQAQAVLDEDYLDGSAFRSGARRKRSAIALPRAVSADESTG